VQKTTILFTITILCTIIARYVFDGYWDWDIHNISTVKLNKTKYEQFQTNPEKPKQWADLSS
jgi:hypothetical protein